MEEQLPLNDLLLILDFAPCGIVTLRAAAENYLPASRQGRELYLNSLFFSPYWHAFKVIIIPPVIFSLQTIVAVIDECVWNLDVL